MACDLASGKLLTAARGGNELAMMQSVVRPALIDTLALIDTTTRARVVPDITHHGHSLPMVCVLCRCTSESSGALMSALRATCAQLRSAAITTGC